MSDGTGDGRMLKMVKHAPKAAAKWWIPGLSVIATACAGYIASKLDKIVNERDSRDKDIIRLIDHQDKQDESIIALRIEVAMLKNGSIPSPIANRSMRESEKLPVTKERLDVYQRSKELESK